MIKWWQLHQRQSHRHSHAGISVTTHIKSNIFPPWFVSLSCKIKSPFEDVFRGRGDCMLYSLKSLNVCCSLSSWEIKSRLIWRFRSVSPAPPSGERDEATHPDEFLCSFSKFHLHLNLFTEAKFRYFVGSCKSLTHYFWQSEVEWEAFLNGE